MNSSKGNHWPFQKEAQVHGRWHFHTCRDLPGGIVTVGDSEEKRICLSHKCLHSGEGGL